MISFYPGPSKVDAGVPRYMQEAFESGILSANHRSPEFVAMSTSLVQVLRDKLEIPDSYKVLFVSSATECWEIISQSLVNKSSFHIYNGAFGQKWHNYATQLQPQAESLTFGLNQYLDVSSLSIEDSVELVAITHNETSNGTRVSQSVIASIKERYPSKLIAIDATSSLAGEALDFQLADVWFASVQKCLGLPAGMAVLICSPQALGKAGHVGERSHYNSLLYLLEMIDKYQTTYTPNVLNMYLLMRVMQERSHIQQVESLLKTRHKMLVQFIEKLNNISLLVNKPEVRSLTVLPFTSSKKSIDRIRQEAKSAGIILGNGYGRWKETSLRLANFPAIDEEDLSKLTHFFNSL